MELIVHGTKGGFRTLFSTEKAPSIATDIRNNSWGEAALGETLYAIMYTNEGIVFTKYCIVRDTIRNYATGSIAFSLLLFHGKKLKGSDIRSTLDQLLQHYREVYIKDNNINLGEANEVIREDWNFAKSILRLQKELPNHSSHRGTPGHKDPAFIYYRDAEELNCYFDAPFQEEYTNYQQIFFVETRLRDEDHSPLTLIRHSGADLTGKIDLDNPLYTLRYKKEARNGTVITVRDNGVLCEPGSKIRRKSELEITWSRLYRKSIHIKEKCADASAKYINLNDELEYAEIIELELEVETRYMDVDIVNPKGEPIAGGEIKVGPRDWEPSLGRLLFRGDEIGMVWNIYARKGNDLVSECHATDPSREQRIEIKLNETKRVKFAVKIDGEDQEAYILNIPGVKITPNRKEIDFHNDMINAEHTVEASVQKGDKYYHGSRQMNPRNDNFVSIDLKQVEDSNVKPHSAPGQSSDLKSSDKEADNQANRNKNKKPTSSGWNIIKSIDRKLGLMICLCIMALGFATWSLVSSRKSAYDESGSSLEKEIVEYTTGLEINEKKLLELKNKLDTTYASSEDNFELLTPATWFGSDPSDTIQTHHYKDLTNKINGAIALRNAVDKLDLPSLKNLEYSDNQLGFKSSFQRLDSNQGAKSRININGIENLGLTQIALRIDSVVNKFKSDSKSIAQENKRKNQPNEVAKKPGESQIPANKQNSNNQSEVSAESWKRNNNQAQTSSSGADQSDNVDILSQLQSENVTKQNIRQWQEAEFQKHSNSIKIYFYFWKLITDGENQKEQFDKILKDVRKDKVLRKSELKTFLETICENTNSFQKFNTVSGKATAKTIKELKSKLQ